MAFEKLSNSLNELNQNLQAFAHTNAEYYKLKFFKQAMSGATSLVRFLILGAITVIAFFLLSFAVAIAISEAIGQPSAGYFIMAGFYIILFILILVFGKKPIEKFMLQKFSKIFFND
ncbi:phage holin family protein [Salegentibacter sediminis]|uniref:phage holin family protein n=1 Tax=Salegentibacter sediminis TaxID=1930251 RepID=UPI0009BE2354|nr:phage holin family protein [Salegentibacter sediminis]